MKPIYLVLAVVAALAVFILVTGVIISGGIHDWSFLSDVTLK